MFTDLEIAEIKTNNLIPKSIFLLNDTTDFESALDPEKFTIYEPMQLQTEDENVQVWIYQTHSPIPLWFNFFRNSLNENGTQTLLTYENQRSSVSSLVLVREPISQRLFALTFGYGKSLIDENCIELNFGRNVVLNLIDKSKLLMIQSIFFTGKPWNKATQAGTASNLHEFEIDCESEVLNRVAGEIGKNTEDESWAQSHELFSSRMVGANSLQLSTKIRVSDLFPLLRKLIELYNDERYLEKVPYIDSIRPVKGKEKIDQLNEQLIDDLKNHRLESLMLSYPVAISHETHGAFSISQSRYRNDNRNDNRLRALKIESLITEWETTNFLQDLSTRHLRSIKISAEGDLPDNNFSAPLIKCLSGSVTLPDETSWYLLEGKWYALNTDFLERVSAFLTERIELDWDLPAFNSENFANENDYNNIIGNQFEGNVFDRKCWHMSDPAHIYNGIKGQIEPCDILFRNENEFLFFHVKRYRSSVDLSHLFTQGTVSTLLLINEINFRQFIFEYLDAQDRPDFFNAIEGRRFRVVFVIIFDRNRPQDANILSALPALSAINLYRTIKELQEKGISVSFCMQFNDAN